MPFFNRLAVMLAHVALWRLHFQALWRDETSVSKFKTGTGE